MKLKRTIDIGMRGSDVHAVNRARARAGYGPKKLLNARDIYSKASKQLTARFQKAKGLKADGVVGQVTLDALVPYFDELATSWYNQHGAYVNPFQHARVRSLERTDQGVDVRFMAGDPFVAMGAGTVTRAAHPGDGTSSWPYGGCLQIRFTDEAGGHHGEEIYHAEDVVPCVTVSQHVLAGDVVAHAGKDGWSENGFIQPGTHNPCSGDTSGTPTEFGINYERWLRELGFDTKEHHGPGSTHGCK